MTDQLNLPATGDSGSRGPLSWDDFEARLVAALERMALDQYLILSTRPAGDDESLYYVQFAQGDRAGFRAEAVSNRYLTGAAQLSPAQEDAMAALGWQFPDPHATKPENFSRQWPMPAPFAEAARLAVGTLRQVYGVGRPADLVYRRFTRDGHDSAEPGLGIDAERPTTPRGKGQPVAATAAELTPLVEAALCRFLGTGAVALDPAGNYPVPTGTTMLFVRILPFEPPVVRVFAPVFRGMAATPELLVALNDLNAELLFCRVLVVNGEVIVATEFRAAGITADDVAWGCLVVGGWVERIGATLVARLGSAGTQVPERASRLLN
jgi:hypothetical protein